MNVTGISIQSFSFSWPQFSKEVEPEIQTQEKDAKIPESIPRAKPKSTVNEIKPEELVMKPSPVSFEERMNQVISPEQMKDLLSMMVRSRMSENPTDHKIDVKR
ncbi:MULTISPECIES: hypothetical protein [Leptospira]|uniref:Uncharacterized protein n=4 Tax=Leptospira weilii TaxID=28184 RepID=M6QAQ0_9LEPT|nr:MULTISPECIES: hypothetical protein [Leptospira]EMN89693.1 hypothetical protein LEP1GSC108_2671 [Leptospira weilii str. UI 13098]MCL8265367.1 hypothetical protein [Leptospira weilii]MDL5244853.1 hypothetical protein [Leptospira weilii]OMI17719.1 hypothetical protein BUQ74_08630 [Leptospira weilii serovar Heyan]QDK23501.1 hypothetical protein FHG67_12795 [Leptospira weilii]